MQQHNGLFLYDAPASTKILKLFPFSRVDSLVVVDPLV